MIFSLPCFPSFLPPFSLFFKSSFWNFHWVHTVSEFQWTYLNSCCLTSQTYSLKEKLKSVHTNNNKRKQQEEIMYLGHTVSAYPLSVWLNHFKSFLVLQYSQLPTQNWMHMKDTWCWILRWNANQMDFVENVVLDS